MVAKIKKLMLWPSRTVDLGPDGYAKLSAGVELEFDQAVDIKDPEVQEALKEARGLITAEFVAQYAPYKALLEKRRGKK